MIKTAHVIINPASGHPEPVLNILNRVFHPAGIQWDISITQKSGDAARFAEEAAAYGVDVVVAYGGDGTQMEVAQGLHARNTLMAVLPGGTANLLSVELGIPHDLIQAAQIIVSDDSVPRAVDMGHAVVRGEKEYYFILRVGIGFEGKKVEKADRAMKDKYGEFAYTIAGIQSLKEVEAVKYHLVLDGREIETEGVDLLVTNAGNFGVSGLTRSKKISVSDGLLDVLVFRRKGLRKAVAATKSVLDEDQNSKVRPMWQAREISIIADPPQPINGDGELWGNTPITIRVVPEAVRILTNRRFPQRNRGFPEKSGFQGEDG